jgi:four helix bundle protein
MTPEELRARSKKFAVNVILFARTIPKDPIHDEIATQLTDAATSTAAHYRAACRARSRRDFINKLGGAIEEVDESALWLEILAEACISPREQTQPFWNEADELTRIFVRSRETARSNFDQSPSKNHQRFNNR